MDLCGKRLLITSYNLEKITAINFEILLRRDDHNMWYFAEKLQLPYFMEGFPVKYFVQFIKAGTKWLIFCRRHCQTHFCECCIFVCCVLKENSLKFLPKYPIDNKTALIQAMLWHWTCGRQALNRSPEAYNQHQSSMCLRNASCVSVSK